MLKRQQLVSRILMLKMQRAARTKERARIISFWKGSLDGNEGEEKPTIGCGSIVKERNESGPAAPLAKALREWRIVDVLSTGPEDKWRTG